MKLSLFFSAFLLLGFYHPSFSGKHDGAGRTMTTKFKVYGNCEMCEKRIETAARIKGVISADWNVDTKILTAQFEESQVQPGQIQVAVAQAGHDTELIRAKDNAYARLPKCCQYERAPKEGE